MAKQCPKRFRLQNEMFRVITAKDGVLRSGCCVTSGSEGYARQSAGAGAWAT